MLLVILFILSAFHHITLLLLLVVQSVSLGYHNFSATTSVCTHVATTTELVPGGLYFYCSATMLLFLPLPPADISLAILLLLYLHNKLQLLTLIIQNTI